MDREMVALDEKMAGLAEECEKLEASHKATHQRELDPPYKVPHDKAQQKEQQKVTGKSMTTSSSSQSSKGVASRPPAKTPLPAGSESEHIYESIPDVSESDEPIYCLPYEAGRAGHRLQQPKLMVQPKPASQKVVPAHPQGQPPQPQIQIQPQSTQVAPQQHPGRSGRGSGGTSSSSGGSSVRERRAAEKQHSVEKWVRENPHPRSPTKSSPPVSLPATKRPDLPQEERDSSSAYNTGDSTGSTHRPPHTLELSLGQDPSLRQSTLTLCPPTHDQSLQVGVVPY